MRIYLLGFMASGKSTFGQRLANELSFSFMDLDEEIEKRVGKSIPQIFEGEGEAFFRKLEHEILVWTAELENTVIATGGGTPCFFENMQWMKQHGATVWLNVPFKVMLKRIQSEKGKRPLAEAIDDEALSEKLGNLLQGRTPFYQQADYTML